MDIETLILLHGPGSCPGCGTDGARGPAPTHLCATCAALTEAPSVRLGKHERAILVACWQQRQLRGAGRWSEADCCTDELPLLLGLRPRRFRGHYSATWNRHHWQYEWSGTTRNRLQATLSRAIRTLYAKGLLDCGSRYEATGHRNERQRREYIKTIRLTHAGRLVAAQLTGNVKNETAL